MYKSIFLTLLVLFAGLQLSGCVKENSNKLKKETDKTVQQQIEVKKKCNNRIVFYNSKCCEDLEAQADFEYVIENIKKDTVLAREKISIMPYEGKEPFKLVCGDEYMKIESILTDIDLLMIVYKFFDIR